MKETEWLRDRIDVLNILIRDKNPSESEWTKGFDEGRECAYKNVLNILNARMTAIGDESA